MSQEEPCSEKDDKDRNREANHDGEEVGTGW